MSTTDENTTDQLDQDTQNTVTETDDQLVDETPEGDNVSLTADDEVIDGEVTLPGDYADCETAEGRTFRVRIINADRIAYEVTARRREWGPAQESPHRALTFMAWNAARREGDPTGRLKFDEFVAQVVECEGRSVARVRPTR